MVAGRRKLLDGFGNALGCAKPGGGRAPTGPPVAVGLGVLLMGETVGLPLITALPLDLDLGEGVWLVPTTRVGMVACVACGLLWKRTKMW